MPEVKARTILFVKAIIDNTGKFSRNINVPFEAHDMIVRSWNVGDSLGGGGNNVLFTMNMQGFGDIFHFTVQESSTPKHIFRANGSISGNIDFTVLDVNGAVEVGLAPCKIIFCLEFIEYFPQKIAM